MGANARQAMFVGRLGRVDDCNVSAVKQNERRPDQRVMRSGKTKDAMAARETIGSAGRCIRRALRAVETNLEPRGASIGVRREGKSAECDQQTLRGDCISDHDANQRPPKLLGPYAKFAHFPPRLI